MIGNDWDIALADIFESAYFAELMARVDKEYADGICYPPREKIFAALEDTPLSGVKVVILGQDPYHTAGMADGHAFSVSGSKLPPSLQNIFKCIHNDYPDMVNNAGDLKAWAKQGVLMLNTCLSVREGQANSHKAIGWEKLVYRVLQEVNKKSNIVFLLWGGPSQKLMDSVGYNPNNLYLKAVHPSPLSAYRGFLTCGHFAKCNEYLVAHGYTPIDFSS